MLAAMMLLGAVEAAPRDWDDPVRATAVPNILVWGSRRTFVNVGFTSTLWQRPFGALYFGFSGGLAGPERAWQITGPELGVRSGPRACS